MKLNEYLADRLREVLTEGKWVLGTNFKEQLADVDWKEATTLIGDCNTIAALTFHIDYYISGVSDALDGEPLTIKDKYSFDMAPIESQEDWERLVATFCSDSETFINQVENLSEEKLLSNFVDERYGTYLRNIDVIIEHTYYHLGQVILLKKKIKTRK